MDQPHQQHMSVHSFLCFFDTATMEYVGLRCHNSAHNMPLKSFSAFGRLLLHKRKYSFVCFSHTVSFIGFIWCYSPYVTHWFLSFVSVIQIKGSWLDSHSNIQMYVSVRVRPVCLNNLCYPSDVISALPPEQAVSLRHKTLGDAAI